MNNWFDVDKEGLKALQAGKPKTFIINELVQNAWDENITKCGVFIHHNKSKNEINIEVRDDNPEGFKDITHAYTLFADTYKRKDPNKRGRFNLGEKQVLSICNYAQVRTTKGTIIFDNGGRHELPEKTKKGSWIEILLDGTEEEAKELENHAKSLLVPEGIEYVVNGKRISCQKVCKTIEASLDTEILREGVMVCTSRKTNINLIESNNQSFIYEMGIPIMETDCNWNIDIQQKIPLAVDRETIRAYYLQDLYAVILNATYEDIPEDDISAVWVRTGMKDERIKSDTVQGILKKRFGGKVLARNPFDDNANDEAISKGYTLINGNQMSKDEWAKVKEFGLIKSTTKMFGTNDIRKANVLKPAPEQIEFSRFAKKVAKEYLGISIEVKYVSAKSCTTIADFNPALQVLRFNMAHSMIPSFDKVNPENLELLVHELGHYKGNHTEHSYHDCITNLAGKLIVRAIDEPEFFEVN